VNEALTSTESDQIIAAVVAEEETIDMLNLPDDKKVPRACLYKKLHCKSAVTPLTLSHSFEFVFIYGGTTRVYEV
jgi:hypothetical protein